MAAQFLDHGDIVGSSSARRPLGLVAIGQTLVILAGSLDLSVAYLISLASLVAAEIMAGQRRRMLPAIGRGAGRQRLVGLVNGLVITRLQVQRLHRHARRRADHQGLRGPRLRRPGRQRARVVPGPRLPPHRAGAGRRSCCCWRRGRRGLVPAAHGRASGYRIYAVGGNEEVARLSGVRTGRVIVHRPRALLGLRRHRRPAARQPAGRGRAHGRHRRRLRPGVHRRGGARRHRAGRRAAAACSAPSAGCCCSPSSTAIFNQLEVNAFFKDVVRGVVIVVAVAVYARAQGKASSA